MPIRGFNTQPPEGGWTAIAKYIRHLLCFNTQPPEGGWMTIKLVLKLCLTFQHTAARRRLVLKYIRTGHGFDVSTHSRPKAAGR